MLDWRRLSAILMSAPAVAWIAGAVRWKGLLMVNEQGRLAE